MVNRIAIGFGLIAASVAAVPAQAVVTVDPSTVQVLDTQVGRQFVRRFTGSFNGVAQAGVSADVVFTFTGVSNFGRRWNFTAEVRNTSGGDFTAATVGLFGFSTDDPFTSGSQYRPLNSTATTGGDFTTKALDNATGFTTPDLSSSQQVCFKTGGTLGECSTTGAGGVDLGQTATQTFALTFSTPQSLMNFENFVMRFTGVSGSASDGEGGQVVISNAELSAFGAIVPEPSSWAMMIAGFGLVGATLRRRRLAVA